MKKRIKVPLWAVIVLGILLAFSFLLPNTQNQDMTIVGWGDNSGGRPSYTIDQINEGVLNDKIIFNSISNGDIGNEKNFVGARVDMNAGKDNVWNANEITVEDNQIYIIRAYIHNNSV